MRRNNCMTCVTLTHISRHHREWVSEIEAHINAGRGTVKPHEFTPLQDTNRGVHTAEHVFRECGCSEHTTGSTAMADLKTRRSRDL